MIKFRLNERNLDALKNLMECRGKFEGNKRFMDNMEFRITELPNKILHVEASATNMVVAERRIMSTQLEEGTVYGFSDAVNDNTLEITVDMMKKMPSFSESCEVTIDPSEKKIIWAFTMVKKGETLHETMTTPYEDGVVLFEPHFTKTLNEVEKTDHVFALSGATIKKLAATVGDDETILFSLGGTFKTGCEERLVHVRTEMEFTSFDGVIVPIIRHI